MSLDLLIQINAYDLCFSYISGLIKLIIYLSHILVIFLGSFDLFPYSKLIFYIIYVHPYILVLIVHALRQLCSFTHFHLDISCLFMHS
jgi:hypothetical protein